MSIRNELSGSASVLSAIDAVRNLRAATVLVGSFVLCGAFMGLGTVLSMRIHPLLGLVLALVAAAIVFYGTGAAGIMVMDEARGGTSRPIAAAVLTSLGTSHRLLLALLLFGLLYLAGLMAIAVLLLVCKVPGLGPLLFAVVFPLSVVVCGVAGFAFFAVVMPLLGPSIWGGATTMQAISQLAAIARQRIVSVVISMLVVMMLAWLVFAIVGGIMMTGTMVAGSMSAGILNTGGFGLASLMGGMGGFGDGAGYVGAGAIGGGLVWAIALVLPGLVSIRGCCQVYLSQVAQVDSAAMEQQLRASLDDARRKAEDIRARGEAMAAASARPPAQPAFAVAAPAIAPAGCPACGSAVTDADLFCGSCGHKLR